MADKNIGGNKDEIVEIRINKNHIEFLNSEISEVKKSLKVISKQFNTFKNHIIFGLLSIIGVLITGIITLITVL